VKLIIGLACALAAAPAAAQQDRPVMVQGGGSVAWNTNPLMQPAAVSDRITTFFAGLRVDQPYAQQRLLLDVTTTAYRYERLSYLDFDALNYSGLWAWRLGRRWNGTIGAERAESLVNYSEFGDPTQRNVLTRQREFASAEHWLGGGWHVRGGLERLQQKYSVPFPQRGNYEAGGADAGVEYVARSSSTAALKFRALDGQFDRPLDPVARLDDGFKRIESELSLLWVATARSTLDLRAGWLAYRSNHFAERDFSGPVGAATYRWAPAARLDVTLRASRALEPWADQNASYRAVDRRGLGARWQIAARTALRFAFDRQDADYRNPLPGFTGAARFDALRSGLIGLEWRAWRNVVLDASLQRQRQSSNEPAAQFEGRVASISASARF
jgi:exopolysaccharide biosynthesis operon protein EpsL